MTRYAGDPRWIEAQQPGNCRSCGGPFARGERVFYWPRRHAVSCPLCGEGEARRFAADVADEELLGGGHGRPRWTPGRQDRKPLSEADPTAGPDCDPRHVEALMRPAFATLEQLYGEQFAREARIAAAAVRADPELAEHSARSMAP